MTSERAIELLTGLLRTGLLVMGPLLFVVLLAGLMVGVLQTATQVQEASISYVVKLVAVVGLLLVVGPALGAEMVRYTRDSFSAISGVVR